MAFVSLKSIIKSQLPVGKVSKPKRLRIIAQIPAGNASVTPPLGPLLGQFGVNILDFCKEFNSRSINFEKDLLLTTIIYIEPSKQYSFIINLPNIAYFLSLYFFSMKDLGLKINNKQFLRYIYDLSLLFFVYNKLYYNKDIIFNFLLKVMGTIRSFQLFFYVKKFYKLNIYNV